MAQEAMTLDEFEEKKSALYKSAFNTLEGFYSYFLEARGLLCDRCSDPCTSEKERFSVSQNRFFELCLDVIFSFVKPKTKHIAVRNLKSCFNGFTEKLLLKWAFANANNKEV